MRKCLSRWYDGNVRKSRISTVACKIGFLLLLKKNSEHGHLHSHIDLRINNIPPNELTTSICLHSSSALILSVMSTSIIGEELWAFPIARSASATSRISASIASSSSRPSSRGALSTTTTTATMITRSTPGNIGLFDSQ